MNHFLTKNGDLFGVDFRASTRRLPAAARRRALAHRGRAVRQACPERSRREQRRNHPKEPPKTCEDCRHSVPAGGHPARILTCRNKAGAPGRLWVVDPDHCCVNFTQDKELLAPELVHALAEGAKLLPLTQDKFAIVDAQDLPRLSRYNWCVVKTDNTCYAVRYCKRKQTFMHRLITSAPPHLVVDHINHNGLDNRKDNLRLCTRAQNALNQRARKGTSSRYKGVYWHERDKRFYAQISHKGRRHHLGSFKSEIKAAKAYDKKAIELFGQFACLNFPDQ